MGIGSKLREGSSMEFFLCLHFCCFQADLRPLIPVQLLPPHQCFASQVVRRALSVSSFGHLSVVTTSNGKPYRRTNQSRLTPKVITTPMRAPRVQSRVHSLLYAPPTFCKRFKTPICTHKWSLFSYAITFHYFASVCACNSLLLSVARR